MPPDCASIGAILLTGEALTRLSPALEADRAQAVADLLDASVFEPASLPPGRHTLHLSIQDGRLVFDIRDADDAPQSAIVLALGPFRRLIKDYLLVVDSHIEAINTGHEFRVQAIDMGRRGLHNEGAELLMQRLGSKIRLDFDTARRLFTLICVLHQRI